MAAQRQRQRRRTRIYKLVLIPYRHNPLVNDAGQSSALDFMDIALLENIFENQNFQNAFARLLHPSGGPEQDPNDVETDTEDSSPEIDYSRRNSKYDNVKKRKIPYIKTEKDPIYIDEKDPDYDEIIADLHYKVYSKINEEKRKGTYVDNDKDPLQFYTYKVVVVGRRRRHLRIAQYFFDILANIDLRENEQIPQEMDPPPKVMERAIMMFNRLGFSARTYEPILIEDDEIDRKFNFRRKSKKVKRKSKVAKRKSKVAKRKSKVKRKSKTSKRKL